MASPASGPQAVDIASLSTNQLAQLKKQLDAELEHLTTAAVKLRAAQNTFRECLKAVQKGVRDAKRGKLADTEKVLVDIGTGFYVEKTIPAAQKFYEAKIADLQSNLKDIEGVVQGKTGNLRVIEEVLRQKVVAAGASNDANEGGGGARGTPDSRAGGSSSSSSHVNPTAAALAGSKSASKGSGPGG